jgi:hypothetical protein
LLGITIEIIIKICQKKERIITTTIHIKNLTRITTDILTKKQKGIIITIMINIIYNQISFKTSTGILMNQKWNLESFLKKFTISISHKKKRKSKQ